MDRTHIRLATTTLTYGLGPYTFETKPRANFPIIEKLYECYAKTGLAKAVGCKHVSVPVNTVLVTI